MIDAYAHIVPPRYLERVEALLADWRPSERVKLYRSWLREDEALGDLGARWRLLGALGVQIHTHVLGRPLDDPRFEPLFARIHALDRTIWLHPARSSIWSDYLAEAESDDPALLGPPRRDPDRRPATCRSAARG